MYQSIITGAAFVICTITDIRHRKVYKRTAVLYFLLAAVGQAAGLVFEFIEKGAKQAGMSVAVLAAGLLPGIVCFAVSWFSRQELGYGDSILIMICGFSLGFWPCMWILFTALFWSAIWALILLCRRLERRREFPFVPFLLIGYVIQSAGGGG